MRKQILGDPKVTAVQISEQRQTPSLIVLNRKNGYAEAQSLTVLSKLLNARQGLDFLVPARSDKPAKDVSVISYNQYFRNVRVDRAGFKAFVKDGNVAFYNGAWYDVPASLAIQPGISEAQALEQARRTVGARKYAWEVLSELVQQAATPQARQALQQELNESLPKGELVIVKDFSRRGIDQVRLAYKFNIYAAEPLSRAWIYVDALNGKILLVDQIIKHAGDPGNPHRVTGSVNSQVQTRYAGLQQIKTKQVTGNDPNSGLPLLSSHPTSEPLYVPGSATYVLIDDTRGGGIETYDLNGVGGLPINVDAVYPLGKSFTDIDNNWTTAEHHRSPANDGAMEAENDDIAWDAHWGAEVVYDYWLAKHGRLSYDGNNAKIKNFIHYGPAYDNAFWNGTAMTYGDGSGTTAGGFKALTSLDVCGHEIGHGVCSHTCDLVYSGESGAMNEGLSDIWASCIEHFAMTRNGSTVPSTAYRPFYIGEQIGANYDAPLRRMDNPKQQGNPDTYGGVNWSDPGCTPNLANDQCGVHTNSGLINKWFFLITAGSSTGTRPSGMTSGQYYFPDSDDGVNDQGESYTVNGVGFDVSENVTFLMETMLSSTATYAEARSVSIEVAKTMSGDPCSALVQTVTNAWYAIGVGDAFASPCTTFYGFISQPGTTVTEQGTAADCNRGITVNVPVLIPANTTVTITATGTATSGIDYQLSTTSYANTTASNQQQNVPVFIYDDALPENTESIILHIDVPGQANVNANYTIDISDNDVLPVVGSDSVQLLNETFSTDNASTPFDLPANWSEYLEIPENGSDPTASTGMNHWGVISGQLGITGKVTSSVTMPDGTYNNLSQSQTIVRTSAKIDARGLNNLRLGFSYTVQGEVDVTSPPGDLNPDHFPKFDYMSIVYSLDGTHWIELSQAPYGPFAALVPTSGTFSQTLPAALNNQQFYLGFRWNNDANAGGPISVKLDNVTLKGLPKKIENDLGNNGVEKVNVNGDLYFYSIQDDELIGSIRSNEAFDFGCTNSAIEHTGNGTMVLYGNNLVSQRVVRITGTNTAGSSKQYTVGLYYTKQQIDNIQSATGVPPAAFKLYRITGTSYTDLGTNNSSVTAMTATYTALPNNAGGLFTATFDGTAAAASISGSYAVGAQIQEAPLPVRCLDFKVARSGGSVNLLWKVAEEETNRSFDIERSTDGINFQPIGTIAMATAANGQYAFTDAGTSGLTQAFYRLKQNDRNGSYHYLCTVLFVSFDGKNVFTIGPVYPNPGGQAASVNITTANARKLRVEYINVSGQVVNWQVETLVAGAARIDLRISALASGSYMIRFKDEQGHVLQTQQYVKQ